MELTVDRIAVGGKGLGLDSNRRVTFVAGAIPTERVRAQITSERSRFAESEVIEVLEPSLDRVDPSCAHAVGPHRCGGCDWQHVSQQGQRRLRVAMVEDALRRIGKLDTTSLTIRSARRLPAAAYRTGVRMLVDGNGRLCYRRRRSNDGFRPQSCEVAHPLVDGLIQDALCPGSSEVSIRVGARTGERMLVVDGEPGEVTAPEDVSVVRLGDGPTAHVHEIVSGRRLRVSAGAFFQSSPQGAELLVELADRALHGVDRSGVLIDAYAGGGLFSATVGRGWSDSGSVIAVEMNSAAVADARVNAPHARIEHARFERWKPVRADAVIADPARAGLAAAGAETIVASAAAVVVLVSCDAGALGRDAGLLTSAGYAVTDVAVVDMFNQTSHVEVVTRFEKIS